MTNHPTLPMRLRTGRLKMFALLMGSLVLAGGGTLAIPKEPVTGYLCIAFFGLCAIVTGINVLPGSSYLELTREGFVIRHLFRTSFIPWRQVREFAVYRVELLERVGWNNLLAPGEQASMGRRVSTALTGVDGGLPDTYGMKAQDLADLLNSVRVQAAASPPLLSKGEPSC